MADWDWVKTALQALVPLVTGTAGLFLGTWQAGKRSGKEDAERELKIKTDLLREAAAHQETLREEMRTAIANGMDDRRVLVDDFRDTFASLRQKINDVEKDGLVRYLPKDDFTDFLKEYRENQRHNSDKLDKLLGLNGARGK